MKTIYYCNSGYKRAFLSQATENVQVSGNDGKNPETNSGMKAPIFGTGCDAGSLIVKLRKAVLVGGNNGKDPEKNFGMKAPIFETECNAGSFIVKRQEAFEQVEVMGKALKRTSA